STRTRCGRSRRLRSERCRATALTAALCLNFSRGIAAGRSASRVPKPSASAGTRWSTACPIARRMPAWLIGRAGVVHSQIIDDAAEGSAAALSEDMFGELDQENEYGCRRASELFPSPEERRSVWLFDIAGPCSDRFDADNGYSRVPTHRN